MAKIKTKQSKQGHPDRAAGNIVSVGKVRVGREIDELTPSFLRWYSEFEARSELALVVLDVVRATFEQYAQNAFFDSASDFEVRAIFDATEAYIASQAALEPTENDLRWREMVHFAWTDYLYFLEDLNLWQRSEDDLQWLHNKFGSFGLLNENNFEQTQAETEMIHVVLAALSAVPLVQLARDFARWSVGEQGAKSAQVLNQDFISRAVKVHDGELLQQIGDKYRQSVLSFVLMGLLDAEVLSIDAKNRVATGPGYADFWKSAGQQGLTSNFLFVQSFLDAFLEVPEDHDLENVAIWGLTNQWIRDGVEDLPHEVAGPRDQQVSAAAFEAAHQRMGVLRALGLVNPGEYYALPGFVAAILTDDDQEQDPEEFLSSFPEERKRERREQPYTGKVLQLKLGMQNAKPPIWRRVLVPMDLNLADLHEVIQMSFDWYDSHLHQFRAGGFRGTSYGPKIEDLQYDEIEDTVLISKLLRAPKDRLDYDYDFGDGWEVRIDVEKILDSAEGQLPRCTAGRRMAPVEDSGGMWGWQRIVELLKNPTDPEYPEIAQWLRESGYDEIDPAAFSVAEINEALETVF